MQRDDDVEIPSLTLDQDEVSDRRPSAAAPKSTPTPPSAKRPTNVPLSAPAQKATNLVGIYSLMAIVILIAAAGGYWLWQQNMQLRSEIYGAKTEIQNLDHQLIAADVSANKQGQTIEETLKTHDSEIRKLWAVAYDRNRKAIAENGAEIDALQKSLVSLKETLSTQSKLIAAQSADLNDIEAGYKKLIPTVSNIDDVVKTISAKQKTVVTQQEALITKQEAVVSQQAAQARQLQSVEGQVALQAGENQTQSLNIRTILQDLASAQQKISALENKSADVSAADLARIQSTLTNHQDAISSSDAFRSQVNSEIIRLRKQINQLVLEQQLSSQ